MDSKIIGIAFDVGAEIARYVIRAFRDNDPASLDKVTDIFPEGHALRSRVALAIAQHRAMKDLGEDSG